MKSSGSITSNLTQQLAHQPLESLREDPVPNLSQGKKSLWHLQESHLAAQEKGSRVLSLGVQLANLSLVLCWRHSLATWPSSGILGSVSPWGNGTFEVRVGKDGGGRKEGLSYC